MTSETTIKPVRENTVATFAIDAVEEAVKNGHLPALNARDPMLAGLFVVLRRVDWNASADNLLCALPHAPGAMSIHDLRSTLSRLGISSSTRPFADSIDATQNGPNLLILPDGEVLLGITENGVCRFSNVVSGAEFNKKLPSGTELVSFYAPSPATQNSFVGSLVFRFQGYWGAILTLRAVNTIVGLIIALGVIAVYDMVIPTGALDTLVGLTVGIAFLLFVDQMARKKRAELTAFVTARMEYLIATLSFRKVYAMPLERLISGSVAQQVNRLRQFSNISSALSAPITEVLLTLPFSAIILGVMFWIAGPLALVPVACLGVFALVAALLLPRLRRLETQARIAREENTQTMTELVLNAEWIRCAGAVHGWQDRARRTVLLQASAHRRAGIMHGLVTAICAASVPMTGGLIAIVGAGQVIAGTMTAGALLGVVILAWRVLAPLQSALMMATRASEVFRLRDQLDRLMALPEDGDGAHVPVRYDVKGHLQFQGVTFRYAGASSLALQNINATLPQGTFVAITGGSGAGKTSLLRLANRIGTPAAGSVLLDGVNLQQIPPVQLRKIIGYVPSKPMLIHGSVAQNLRLASPLSPDHELQSTLDELGLHDAVARLPDGLNTRLSSSTQALLPTGFTKTLALAQALLARPRILLLDEPAQSLDPGLEDAMMAALLRLRGVTTTLMVTHRPSHIRVADVELQLHQGKLASLKFMTEQAA